MKKLVIFLLIVGVVILAFVLTADQTEAPTPEESDEATTTQSMTTGEDGSNNVNATENEEDSSQSDNSSEMVVSVTYTDDGYSPSTVEISAGDTVTFMNDSSKGMWTASALHPTHRIYDGTSLNDHCNNGSSDAFDACREVQPGDSWSFTFNKAGEWGYHNHTFPGDTGAVIVN